jgi:hypothetical protein
LRIIAVAILPRAVVHASDTRGFGAIAAWPPAETARTILSGYSQVKKRNDDPNALNSQQI